MNLDIDNRFLGIVCRDRGLIRREVGAYDVVNVRVGNEYCRKGSLGYALVLDGILRGLSERSFKYVMVVGDGESDVRLLGNLGILAAQDNRNSIVMGFFIRHEILAQMRDGYDGIKLYNSWSELGEELSKVLTNCTLNRSDGVSSILIVDVDRTLIVPRGVSDNDYSEMRRRAVGEYVLSFLIDKDRIDINDQAVDRLVAGLIDVVGAGCSEYNNEFNAGCFKNEDVIAILVLLLCVGTVVEPWIVGLQGRPLVTLLRHSIKMIEHGGWIDRLSLEILGNGVCVAGEEGWRRTALIYHLRDVLINVRGKKPVLCEQFREQEGLCLASLLQKKQCDLFNQPLLRTLRGTKDTCVLFVTDRPAVSLNIYADDVSCNRITGMFWNMLRKCLNKGN